MKRWLSLCLVLALLLASVPTGAFVLPTKAEAIGSDDLEVDFGEWDDLFGEPSDYTFRYEVTDGKATITGAEESIDGALVLPDVIDGYPVVGIGYMAFAFESELTSVVIPDSVTVIDGTAFGYCYGLKSVIMGDGVTTIRDFAFSSCNALETVVFSDSLTTIGNYAFHYCSSLTAANIPDSVTSIGSSAFYACYDLSELRIGAGVESIGGNAFHFCDSLTTVTIPDSVTEVGVYAFAYCEALTDVTVGSGVSDLSATAFDGCSKLTNVNISPNNPHYFVQDDVLFGNDGVLMRFLPYNTATEYVIPNTVTAVGDGAFANCSALTHVAIPDSVTAIGNRAFYGCESLYSVEIPDSVETIGDYVFADCYALTKVTVGAGLSSIGTLAFSSCKALQSITVSEANAAYCAVSSVLFTKDRKTLLRYPSARPTVRYTLPATVTRIEDGAFADAALLTTVTIRGPVTAIGHYAFENCSSLESLIIPGGVTELGDGAFRYCTSLSTVTLGDGLTVIPYDAFYNCSALTYVAIPDSVTEIGSYAFYNCGSLESVQFGGGLKVIGSGAFMCSGLTSVRIPSGVEWIYGEAFTGSSNLSSVTVVGMSTYIEWNSFLDCAYGMTVYAPMWSQAYYYAMSNGIAFQEFSSWCDHVYDNVCDAFCNACGEARTTAGHVYDSACDEDCNVCGGVRTTAGHVYDHACDALCNECGEARTTAGHVYDDFTDTDCNACGEVRDALWYFIYETVAGQTVSITGIDPSVEGAIVIPATIEGYPVTRIDRQAFMNRPAITSVTIPDSVTVMGADAFYNCTGIADVYITDLAVWCESSFSNYWANPLRYGAKLWVNGELATDVVIPDGVKRVRAYAFANYIGLNSITLPNSVTLIGENAFDGCSSLTAVTYNGTEEQAGGMTVKKNNQPLLNAKWTYTEEDVCEHVYDNACDAYCNVCGEARTVAEHVYGEEFTLVCLECGKPREDYVTGTVPPTCTEDGYTYYIFDNGTIYTFDVVPATGHTYTTTVTPPTCTDDGYTTYTCTVCGASYTADYVGAVDHSYSVVVILPGCLSEGYTSYTCTVCGNRKTDDFVSPTGHTYKTAVTPPTCSQQGYTTYTCVTCGFEENRDYVEVTAHPYEETVVPPTCTEQGYTVHNCPVCTHAYIDSYVDPTGHTFATETVAPDCEYGGYTRYACTVCDYQTIGDEVPALGHAFVAETTPPTCSQHGYTTYTCTVCGRSMTDNMTPPTEHPYGDWIVEKAATVLQEGSRHRTCTACGDTQTQVLPRVQIDIETNADYGLAQFTVVHAQTLKPIKGAQLFITTENDGENTFTTDENGKVSVVLPVGKQSISAYAEGCLVRSLKVAVASGVNEIPLIGLSERLAYDAQITSKELTKEEMLDLGIDLSHPDNRHVYKYELTLEFEAEIDIPSIEFYFNAENKPIPNLDIPDDIDPIEPDKIDDDSSVLHYHVAGGGKFHSWCKYEVFDRGEKTDLTYTPTRMNWNYTFDGWYADENFTQRIEEAVLDRSVVTVYGRWIYTGDDDSFEDSQLPEPTPVKVDDEEWLIYPVSEYFYLIVRGEVTWLKEMFDIEMLVFNHSETDTLENLTATLDLPEGLSLAPMSGPQQALTQSIPMVESGKGQSVHWYVRGDEAGYYNLSARLQGMIMPFEEPIDEVFFGEELLQVWAGNALQLNLEVPEAAYYAEEYPLTVTLTNVSDKVLYDVHHLVQVEEGMEVYYSDGSVGNKRVQLSNWASAGMREFHPGDRITIQFSANIFFESKVIEHQLQQYIDRVDDLETLMTGIKVVSTILNAGKIVKEGFGSVSKVLKGIDLKALRNVNKGELIKQLWEELDTFVSMFEDVSYWYNTAADKDLAEINTVLEEVYDNPEEWVNAHSEEEIEAIIKKLEATKNGVGKKLYSDKFNIFDSLRTAISAIPIRFYLKNIVVTEDASNTTRIPWTYTKTKTGPRYFGVSSVSKYINALTTAAVGEIYGEVVPWYLQLVPGLDDPFSKEEAVEYIKATERRIALVKAKDATGKITFEVLEPAVSTYSLRSGGGSNFELSCDNETAVYENGVLTFTGDGMIEITPKNQNGGILQIRDSEGNVYTYVIDVVEEHECTAGDNQVMIAPTADAEGYAVKCCEICDEIMDIVTLSAADCHGGHAFGEWETLTEPTCKADGLSVRYCDVCGFEESLFTAGDPHTYDNDRDTDCNVCETERRCPIGDVNGDREVDNRDAILLTRYANNWDVEINTSYGEVTGDGEINNRDIIMVTRYINDWDVVLK